MLFDIRNATVSLFQNGFIKSLECQSTVKLKPKSKPGPSVGERTKLRNKYLIKLLKEKGIQTFDCLDIALNIEIQVICTKN